MNKKVVDNKASIFPNPYNDIISIKIDKILLGTTFKLMDYLGREVLNGKLSNETTKIDISSFSTGLYFFQIGQENKQTFKVIRQ